MSLGEFINDLASLNFSSAGHRFKDWLVSSAWPGLKSLMKEAASEEGTIVEKIIENAANNVLARGLTTEVFVDEGKKALAELVAQNITTFNMQHVMSLINAEVAPKAPPVQAPVEPETQQAA